MTEANSGNIVIRGQGVTVVSKIRPRIPSHRVSSRLVVCHWRCAQ